MQNKTYMTDHERYIAEEYIRSLFMATTRPAVAQDALDLLKLINAIGERIMADTEDKE